MKGRIMDLAGKTVLVVGLGISGMSAVSFLNKRGAEVIINDLKTEDELKEKLSSLQGKYKKAMLGLTPEKCFDGVDLIVISPGVDFNNPWVKEAQILGIKIISETELAYYFIPCDIVAITGTNGKTTSTTLVGEIFKDFGRRTHVVGNIGTAITSRVDEMKEGDIVVCELSSFQILNCREFAPKVFAFLNLTPDHLDKYGTMERYAESKAMMLDMMHKDSYSILNMDDSGVAKYKDRVKGKLLWFTRKKKTDCGAFVKDGKVYFSVNGKEEYIIDAKDIRIMGNHNLENALSAVCITRILGVNPESIRQTLMNFGGVEHRLEPCGTYKGVAYINDSKGTNTDAAITAIRAMDKPTVLIAGGYDKGSEFDDYVKEFGDKIKAVVITGDTMEKIAACADKYGYKSYYTEKNFDDAVRKAAELAESGNNVLLSPACASWDCFKNYEERGKRFKEIVKELNGE